MWCACCFAGISSMLLFVMGSRFKDSGKVFPAGVVALSSFIMAGGYIHGILRTSHVWPQNLTCYRGWEPFGLTGEDALHNWKCKAHFLEYFTHNFLAGCVVLGQLSIMNCVVQAINCLVTKLQFLLENSTSLELQLWATDQLTLVGFWWTDFHLDVFCTSIFHRIFFTISLVFDTT